MTADVIPLHDRAEAIAWGDKWQAHAERMQALYELACIRCDMSEALREVAEAELEHVRGDTSDI